MMKYGLRSSLMVLLTSLAACAPTIQSGLLIENATIVSADKDTYQADVHISDGRIQSIGSDLRAGSGTEVIDATGLHLTPGLIDSHVHVGHPIGLSDEQIESYPELYEAYMAQVPRSYLYFGFTTLIDLDLRERNKTRFEGAPLRPRLLGCGRGIRQPGGYGPALFPPELRYRIFPEFVWDERFADEVPDDIDPAEHSVEKVVERIAQAGAVCIKTYAEPGFGGIFDWPIPSQSTLTALREEAHKHNLPFIVHATGVEGWRAAIDAGADIMAHGLWHWDGDRLVTELPDDALAVIGDAADIDILVQPTMQVLHGERLTYTWQLIDDPRLAHAIPPSLLAWMRTDEAQWSRRDLKTFYDEATSRLGYPDTPHVRFMDAMDARVAASSRTFIEAGGTLIFGSDTPAQEGLGNPPGLNGVLEIQRWHEAGIPPATIFNALTIGNARAFRLNDLGRVAPGMRADLLLMEGNPLIDVGAYETIQTVFIDGKPVSRENLSATE